MRGGGEGVTAYIFVPPSSSSLIRLLPLPFLRLFSNSSIVDVVLGFSRFIPVISSFIFSLLRPPLTPPPPPCRCVSSPRLRGITSSFPSLSCSLCRCFCHHWIWWRLFELYRSQVPQLPFCGALLLLHSCRDDGPACLWTTPREQISGNTSTRNAFILPGRYF